jgi:hypothetical protein
MLHTENIFFSTSSGFQLHERIETSKIDIFSDYKNMFAIGMLAGCHGVFIISNMRLCACVSVRACVLHRGRRCLVATDSIHELHRAGSVTVY